LQAVADEEFFREFEHTGDLGIEVRAPSRAELFSRAAIALGRLMVAVDGIAAVERRTVEAGAESDDDLMHDVLADALNLFLADGFIWRDATAEERPGGVAVTLIGEPFDRGRHDLLTEVKAVTYHELKVERAAGGWRARIIFDV
jgi:protein archease